MNATTDDILLLDGMNAIDTVVRENATWLAAALADRARVFTKTTAQSVRRITSLPARELTHLESRAFDRDQTLRRADWREVKVIGRRSPRSLPRVTGYARSTRPCE